MSIVKRQHYVFREYLRPWATKDLIWCLRQRKTFGANLMGVAVENYFYRLSEITEEQVELIQRLFLEDQDPTIRKLNQWWIDAFTLTFRLKRLLKEYPSSPKLEEEYRKAEINMEEQLQGHIEYSAIPHLKSLRDGDCSFYLTTEGNIQFNIYLTAQYFRTKNMQEGFLQNMERMRNDILRPGVANYHKQLMGDNPKGIWSIVRQILATNVSAQLHLEREQHQLLLLENKTPHRFITGDQPVINTFAYGLDQLTPPEELELYYPITPTRAIIVRERPKKADSTEKIEIDEDQVDLYNKIIADLSHEQIFASEEEDLIISR